jgi:hypothetical protein
MGVPKHRMTIAAAFAATPASMMRQLHEHHAHEGRRLVFSDQAS